MQSIAGESDFKKVVIQSNLPTLVDFWAQWCAPCLAADPVLEELAKEYEGKVNFAKVNVDGNSPLAAKYGVAAIPTMIIFKDGQPVQQIIGFKRKKDLMRVIDDLLQE